MKPQRLIKTHRWKAFSIAFQLAASAALATTYNLSLDWSDSANPSGPWSYNEGANPLPHQSAWQGLAGDFTSAQPAWARGPVGNTNLPCWFKSSATIGIAHDWQTGDILTHTTDNSNGVGSGPANVTWTSPGAGSIAIAGSVWMGRDIGRGNHWALSHNGVMLTQGDIFSGDVFSRANPFNFASGTGGAAVLTNRSVATGDVITLQLDKTSPAGDYTGVNFTIDFIASFELRITTVEKFTNDLRLTFTSQAGKAYAIQSRSNLISGVWTTLSGTTNSATGNLLQTTLTNAFTEPQQFFRVWQLP
jgi:hypothetical protein